MSNPKPETTIQDFVAKRNREKALFTAGPASLLEENLLGLCPCFGRGDLHYEAIEQRVLQHLLAMTGHSHIVRLQGSATLALEIASLNFLAGRILIISSGYYSDRLNLLCLAAQKSLGCIRSIETTHWTGMDSMAGPFDWVVGCYTETSNATLLPIQKMRSLCDAWGARLMLDATASIGLEDDHDLADLIAYSSCKGLFGLTGAAFISYSQAPQNQVDSFYLNIGTHLEKRVTGPYHAIASLDAVLSKHDFFREGVRINKERFTHTMLDWLTLPEKSQPQLCTHTTRSVKKAAPHAVIYSPRGNSIGSVVCHLGEAHLGDQAKGEILKLIEWD